MEEDFEALENEALEKLAQSESDLEAAIAIRNRTAALQIKTQEQLLLVESKLVMWSSRYTLLHQSHPAISHSHRSGSYQGVSNSGAADDSR